MVPLTVTTLCELPDGKWLWIHVLKPHYAPSGYYRIYKHSAGVSLVLPGASYSFNYNTYGSLWLAYYMEV